MTEHTRIITWKKDLNGKRLEGVGHLDLFSKKTMSAYLREGKDPNEIFAEAKLVPTGRKIELASK